MFDFRFYIKLQMVPGHEPEGPYEPQEGLQTGQDRVTRLAQSGPFSVSFFKNALKHMFDPCGAHFGPFGPILGLSWAHLWPIWGSLAPLRLILGPFSVHVAPLGSSGQTLE